MQNATSQDVPQFPREIAPGIHWLGWCLPSDQVVPGQTVHLPAHCFLVVGAERTLMFDTCQPENWEAQSEQLDRVLGDRPLDYVMPSHQEIGHAANTERLMRKYPDAKLVGDVRDYHLYISDAAERSQATLRGSTIDLGGGYRVRVLDAPIKDHPATVWAYEESQQVLFCADGFGFVHSAHLRGAQTEDVEVPGMHAPGECALLTSELGALGTPPTPEDVAFATRGALYWSRYADVGPFLKKVRRLFDTIPIRLLAPSHGNVIDNIDEIVPVVEEAYRLPYQKPTAA
jgi:flavorubredoxin